MTSDDRDDIESTSPASFKVGEVDRLSGFFTPVWESKRRLRAESPIPSASAAAAPSSSGTESDGGSVSEAPARQPSQPPPPRRAPAGAFVAATPPRASRPPVKGRPSASPPRREPDGAARGGSNAAVGGAYRAEKKAAASASTPPKAAVEAASEPAPTPRARPEEPVVRAAAADAGGELAAPGAPAEPALDGLTPSVAVRPVIPMPQNPGRTTPRAKSSSAPPAAEQRPARRAGDPSANGAPEHAAPREPELRAAPPTSAPPARASWPAADQRAVRAAGAAAVLHDKLRSKSVDSADTFGRHRETESEREALQRQAARAAATPADPYPLHLLRTLRRTLHLSMPLPESVRAMIDKYRY
jgi:hypothetical protein